jgi:Asp-tRNA(Asn)/Glu-tRNA(Gln) amidotransferase A subunit family amidase
LIVTDSELTDLTLRAQAKLIRERELSPVELTNAYLDRIEALNPTLNAYITVTAETAQHQARMAADEIAHGTYRGPLHGITYGVKDQLFTKAAPTTLGWRKLQDNHVAVNATVVDRMDDAGAVLLGKHNLDQFGKGGATSWDFGEPKNPWNLAHSPTGSSQGSAASVAAGLSAVAIGEDTGGSIRMPAAACGLAGLRPTFGRVSRHGGYLYGWTADTVGPFTRTVEDNALLLEVIAGYDPQDPLSVNLPVPKFSDALRNDLTGVKVGVVRNLADSPALRDDVKACFDSAVATLKQLGATVVPVNLPSASYAVPLLMLTSDVDVAAQLLRKFLREHYHDIDYGIRTRLAAACVLPASAYATAMQGRAAVRAEVLALFHQVDCLVTPMTPQPAPTRGRKTEPLSSPEDFWGAVVKSRIFSYPFSLANTPALSVPNGFTEAEGLPVGLQIVAAPLREDIVYHVGHAYEQATSWHMRRPAIASI